MSPLLCHFIQQHQLTELPIRNLPGGGYGIACPLERGFYQFSVVADGSLFDWEAMYIPLYLYENSGQITGPWDFNLLDHNRPLIPSYWVSINQRRIGPWFFQRVAFEDIGPKRFRGRFAFYCAEAGEHQIELVPLYPAKDVAWVDVKLEVDPESALYHIDHHTAPSPLPFEQRKDSAFWKERALRARGLAGLYQKALPILERFSRNCIAEPFMIDLEPGQTTFFKRIQSFPALLICWKLTGDERLLHGLHARLEQWVEAPHWGGFGTTESYGTDGDINGALIYFHVTSAFCILRDDLDQRLIERLRKKLWEQGRRFFDLALLNRDYWGGSVLQDHGWRSFSLFATATLHLRKEIPDADLWSKLMIWKIDQALQVAPTDGAIPLSAYRSLRLWVNPVVGYRESLLAIGCGDIFDSPVFQNLPRYLATLLPADLEAETKEALQGLNALATKLGDAWLKQLFCKALNIVTDDDHDPGNVAEALFWHSNITPLSKEESPAPRLLSYFEESGLVVCMNPQRGFRFSLQCGPAFGSRAWRGAQGPSDRLDFLTGAGHFELTMNKTVILGTPRSIYKLTSSARSCLLIDGKGSTGDIGYPMSLPTQKINFGEVVFARENDCGRAAEIRLNLTNAYPEEQGIISYYRDFFVESDQVITLVDSILLTTSRSLSWLFQCPEQLAPMLAGDRECRFDPACIARWESAGAALHAKIVPTDVVFSYGGARDKYSHLRLTTEAPVRKITVRIEFRPGANH